MHYVYILVSQRWKNQTYVGMTSNLRKRLSEHNSGKSGHTKRFLPWGIMFYAAFPEKVTAERFERYLKSGSGRAFARKHLIPVVRPEDSERDFAMV